jgi:hypothetical protein
MSGAVGLNPDQLRTLITKLSGASQQTEQARQLVNGALTRTYWEGPDATQFRSLWQNHTNAELNRLVLNYEQRVSELKRQLADQIQTSEAGAEVSNFPLLLPPGASLGAPAITDGNGSVPNESANEGPIELPDDPERVRDHLLEQVADKCDDPNKAREVIEGLSNAELTLIQDLFKHGLTTEQAKQLLQGGQVEIETGNLYEKWIKDTEGQHTEREWRQGNAGTSHHPDGVAYEVDGTGNILFWEKNGKTRIQMEGHGTSLVEVTAGVSGPAIRPSIDIDVSLGEAPGHLGDLIQNKAPGFGGQNIGPAGTDSHGDKNPIRLK